MAYPDGFTYVRGPKDIQWFNVASAATFKKGNPVALSDVTRDLIEATSASTEVIGIAMSDAANSIGGTLAGKMPVILAAPGTVFATKVQTGVAAGVLEGGESFNIEKSGNFLRVDTDSKASALVRLVARGFGDQTYDSADSSVYCTFIQGGVGPFYSTASHKVGV